jgi:hypothetical protein
MHIAAGQFPRRMILALVRQGRVDDGGDDLVFGG